MVVCVIASVLLCGFDVCLFACLFACLLISLFVFVFVFVLVCFFVWLVGWKVGLFWEVWTVLKTLGLTCWPSAGSFFITDLGPVVVSLIQLQCT